MPAAAEEWLKVAGAIAWSSTSRAVSADACEMSTRMAFSCTQRTVFSPCDDSPPNLTGPACASASAVGWSYARMSERRPSAARRLIVASSTLMRSGFSITIRMARSPERWMARTSSDVVRGPRDPDSEWPRRARRRIP